MITLKPIPGGCIIITIIETKRMAFSMAKLGKLEQFHIHRTGRLWLPQRASTAIFAACSIKEAKKQWAIILIVCGKDTYLQNDTKPCGTK